MKNIGRASGFAGCSWFEVGAFRADANKGLIGTELGENDDIVVGQSNPFRRGRGGGT